MGRISTRKRGTKNTSWYYSFEASLEGKRKRIEKGGFATEKEALEAGTIAQAKYLQGDVSITSEKIKVKDFMESWLENKRSELRPTSIVSYDLQSRRFMEALGDMYLQDIRPRDIDRAIKAMAGKGFSHGTIQCALSVIKNALNYAVYPCEFLQTNPARLIKVPKNAPRHVVKRHIIGLEKLNELLEAFPFGHPMHIPILLSYGTGMRMGEVLGLTWDCVDLDSRTLAVDRQLLYVRAGFGYIFGEPKNPTSRRTILIDEKLTATLRQWKARQAANELELGRKYFYAYEAPDGKVWQAPKGTHPEGMTCRPLVCTYRDGKLLHRCDVIHSMRVHGLNFHSLRHTHATICAENGAPAKGLAGRLGHSDTRITENLYTHETRLMQEETLAAFMGAKRKKKMPM